MVLYAGTFFFFGVYLDCIYIRKGSKYFANSTQFQITHWKVASSPTCDLEIIVLEYTLYLEWTLKYHLTAGQIHAASLAMFCYCYRQILFELYNFPWNSFGMSPTDYVTQSIRFCLLVSLGAKYVNLLQFIDQQGAVFCSFHDIFLLLFINLIAWTGYHLITLLSDFSLRVSSQLLKFSWLSSNHGFSLFVLWMITVENQWLLKWQKGVLMIVANSLWIDPLR